MITALDSTVLFDVLARDPHHVTASKHALRDAAHLGGLVACDVVWAEVAAWFPDERLQAEAFSDLGLAFSATGSQAAHLAGAGWRAYRAAGGKRNRLVGDFLIGAHAQIHADRLLTRDRGFFRNHFADLVVVEP